MKKILNILFGVIVLTLNCQSWLMALELRSPAFSNNSRIPEKYTCQGINVSPPLYWTAVPEATKSLVIVCDDYDAAGGSWIHWLIYNIPPEVRELKEAIPADFSNNGIGQGLNDYGNAGYRGPCPPFGKNHRYFFKIYCLDIKLNLAPGPTKPELYKEMNGHAVDEAELTGIWGR